MRQGLPERGGEVFERRAGNNSQDGFAETVDAVGGFQKLLGGDVAGGAGNDHL